MPRNPAYSPEPMVSRMMGPREALYVAMAAIVTDPDWWCMPEAIAMRRALDASKGRLPPEVIATEIRAMRADRDLRPAGS
jgi:hypothetical protein